MEKLYIALFTGALCICGKIALFVLDVSAKLMLAL